MLFLSFLPQGKEKQNTSKIWSKASRSRHIWTGYLRVPSLDLLQILIDRTTTSLFNFHSRQLPRLYGSTFPLAQMPASSVLDFQERAKNN